MATNAVARVAFVGALLLRQSLGGLKTDVKTCYDGYILNRNNLCVQDVNEDPHYGCPVGYPDEKNRCKVQLPKMSRCAEGYTRDANGNCSYSVTSDLQYFCPAGFYDDGTSCVMTLPGTTTEFCAEGTLRVGDQCMRLQRTEPTVIVSCPEDSILEEGRCWKTTEPFDCADACEKKGPARLPFTCDRKPKDSGMGATKAPQQHLSSPRQLAEQEPALVPVTPPKPFRLIIVSQSCTKMYEVPAMTEHVCPQGFLKDAKGCFREETFPLQTKCVATGGPAHECPPIVKRSEKIARCPEGTTPIKGKCEELVLGDPIAYCPAGYTEVDGMCEGTVDASLQCPPEAFLKNGRCVGKRTHVPLVLSPEESDVLELPETSLKGTRLVHHAKPKVKPA